MKATRTNAFLSTKERMLVRPVIEDDAQIGALEKIGAM